MEKIAGLKSEKGVSLIELLAGLALLSIILLLASSVHLFGQKQMTGQSNEIQNQSEERLAIKYITKEIRKSEKVVVNNTTNQLTINDTDVYQLVGTSLQKNNVELFSRISKFIITRNGNKVNLTVGKLPETIIFIRE
jgi:prepilin-type N-terminal cleavage/methylation domain-containing protein